MIIPEELCRNFYYIDKTLESFNEHTACYDQIYKIVQQELSKLAPLNRSVGLRFNSYLFSLPGADRIEWLPSELEIVQVSQEELKESFQVPIQIDEATAPVIPKKKKEKKP